MPAGLVLAAMAGLWIAYLVPHWLRHRQQLLESRVDDRFSDQLRVIRVARGHTDDRPDERAHGQVQQVVLHPGARGGGGPMDRPHATTDRVAADAARRRAADHARLAAARARRSARARRRAALAIMLLAATVAGWSGVAASGVTVAFGIVPSALLLSVLVLGRRAAIARPRELAEPTAPAVSHVGRRATRAVVGRAVRPSDAATEVMARVAARIEAQESVSEPSPAVETPTWVPVPVPAPAYTLKAAVRRAEPAPLVLEEFEPAAAESAPLAAPDAGAPATGPLDLDAVLARRRASGE